MIWPIAFSAVLSAQQSDWTLTYEKTNFAETGRYKEALDFCRRLDAASPNATVLELGNSPEGRPMIMLILSKDRKWKMGERKKPLVYLQNGIHSGEIEGKDACLALAREIILPNREKPGMRALLDKIDIAILPVFSVDAHERMTPYNRINQNDRRKWVGGQRLRTSISIATTSKQIPLKCRTC
ncbi:MAG: M14 family zinc carboxypeptidase [Fimbriimonadaceae bacterium]